MFELIATFVGTLSEPISIVVGALIAFFGSWLGMRNISTHQEHDLFIQSLELLTGKSQTRNVGISAIGLFLQDKRYRYRSRAALIGAAIFLLVESGQGDKKHEQYNLSRMMQLLLTDPSKKRWPPVWPWQRQTERRALKGLCEDYRHLREAILEARGITPREPTTFDAGDVAGLTVDGNSASAEKVAKKGESDSEGKQGLEVSPSVLKNWENKLDEVLICLGDLVESRGRKRCAEIPPSSE